MDKYPSSSSIPTPALVIDGSGTSIFTGVLGDDGQWLAYSEKLGAPLEKLFPAVEATLKTAKLSLEQIQSYIYCEGPGSVLGLRLCAMAIETWSRLYPASAHTYAYNTLQLCAHLIIKDLAPSEATLVVSDWKKGAWNAVYINNGSISETGVADDRTIADWEGALYHLPQRKGWQSPPPKAETLSHTPARLIEVLKTPQLVRATQGVELYSAGVNTFAKWNAERHRA